MQAACIIRIIRIIRTGGVPTPCTHLIQGGLSAGMGEVLIKGNGGLANPREGIETNNHLRIMQ